MKRAVTMTCLILALLVSTGGLSYSLDRRAVIGRQVELIWQVDGVDQEPPVAEGVPKALTVGGTVYIPMQLLAAVQDYTVDINANDRLVSLQQIVRQQLEPKVIVQQVVVERKPSPPPVINEPPMPPAPTVPVEAASWEERANAVLAMGDALLGTPHKYGSMSGQTESFDCSSFVQYVYQQNGITLFRSSEYQAMQGVEIAKEDLRKGDLVFFSSTRSGPDKIGHVAIYAGDGLLLHTFNERGVTYSPIDGAYWSSHYMTARRVFIR